VQSTLSPDAAFTELMGGNDGSRRPALPLTSHGLAFLKQNTIEKQEKIETTETGKPASNTFTNYPSLWLERRRCGRRIMCAIQNPSSFPMTNSFS
jgi:hypothetical protein